MRRLTVTAWFIWAFATLMLSAGQVQAVGLCVNDINGRLVHLVTAEVDGGGTDWTWRRLVSVQTLTPGGGTFSPISVVCTGSSAFLLGHDQYCMDLSLATLEAQTGDFGTAMTTAGLAWGLDVDQNTTMYAVSQALTIPKKMYPVGWNESTGARSLGTPIEFNSNYCVFDELQGLAYHDGLFYVTDGSKTVRVFQLERDGQTGVVTAEEQWCVDMADIAGAIEVSG